MPFICPSCGAAMVRDDLEQLVGERPRVSWRCVACGHVEEKIGMVP